MGTQRQLGGRQKTDRKHQNKIKNKQKNAEHRNQTDKSLIFFKKCIDN